MGLPQVSPKQPDEVTTSLSTFVLTPPRFGGISSCDLSGLHDGNTDDYPCSSISDFQKKTTLEMPKETDVRLKYKSAIDGATNLHKLKIVSKERIGCFAPKAVHDVQSPVLRVVGFQSRQSGSPLNVVGNVVGISDNSIDSHGSQVRKRMLSPLNGLLHKQFQGKSNTCSRAIAISPKKGHSPPLSLSPLGPKLPERMKTTGACRDFSKDIESDFSVMKGINETVGGSLTDILFASEDEFRTRDTFDGTTDGSHLLTLQRHSYVVRKWGPGSAPTPHCLKFLRNLGMHPIRRSLVGSFEESLLSGRFSSGKISQRIDGFLAVLNVTGGSFSPPSLKLPFAVSSIDGESSLLYYASIDLAGNLPSNRGRGPKLKRSLSNNDSRAAKSRLRIPMKGRIQLVLSNPEMTPLHTFLCTYDLSDMPAGSKLRVEHHFPQDPKYFDISN